MLYGKLLRKKLTQQSGSKKNCVIIQQKYEFIPILLQLFNTKFRAKIQQGWYPLITPASFLICTCESPLRGG